VDNIFRTAAEDMDLLVDVIINKAVTEHALCEMYADICVVLLKRFSSFPRPNGDAGRPSSTFSRALFNRLQQEFEDLPHHLGPTTQQSETLSADELEEIVNDQRDRIIGYMKFTGQLSLRKFAGYSTFAGYQISWERVITCLEALLFGTCESIGQP
jgi:hypothetical protein